MKVRKIRSFERFALTLNQAKAIKGGGGYNSIDNAPEEKEHRG